MTSFKLLAAAGAAALVFSAAPSRADVFNATVYTGDIGSAFNAVTGSAALFTAATRSQEATFTYSGPIAFMNTAPQNTTSAGDLNSTFVGPYASGVSNYVDVTAAPAVTPDYGSFATLASFGAASGSIAGYGYGSLILLTDTTQLAAGTTLTITHDDGATVYDNGVALPGTTSGPTSAVTETVILPTAGVVTIAYARENGTPSILTVSEAVPAPEPASVAVLGVALAGLGGLLRRRA